MAASKISGPSQQRPQLLVLPPSGTVLDIGGSRVEATVRQNLLAVLARAANGGEALVLPDELLYDSNGHSLWSQIIYHTSYYQTRDEIASFQANGAAIVDNIRPGAILIDIGSGDTRKVCYLIEYLEAKAVRTTYVALDISKESLVRNLEPMLEKCTYTRCIGLWGDFAQGMAWFSSIANNNQGVSESSDNGGSGLGSRSENNSTDSCQRVLLSLGSVLCNGPWSSAISLLAAWAETLCGPDDFALVGMDGHDQFAEHAAKIWRSYHFDDGEPFSSSANSIWNNNGVVNANTAMTGNAASALHLAGKANSVTPKGRAVGGPNSGSSHNGPGGDAESKASRRGVPPTIASNPNSLFSQFWRSGFNHANTLLGDKVFKPEDWNISSYLEAQAHGGLCHHFVLTTVREVLLPKEMWTFLKPDSRSTSVEEQDEMPLNVATGTGKIMASAKLRLPKGLRMEWFDAHKYGPQYVKSMCDMVGLDVEQTWKSPNRDSHMHHYLLRPR